MRSVSCCQPAIRTPIIIAGLSQVFLPPELLSIAPRLVLKLNPSVLHKIPALPNPACLLPLSNPIHLPDVLSSPHCHTKKNC
ncbi:hypothetical protein PtA15_6A704 [Puccinia triticina]|uniref:Uncharacterized protein n=1 Tax=Puccinia triticina TaxID=208348 RepID=A0ABY7CLP5_9BASI|nr:uncharacterized protein PtA15_6A704 [Puccinia triticina]WAQ86074.1 hypothetical protein PtA15_6A704 [Puccinia triticina]